MRHRMPTLSQSFFVLRLQQWIFVEPGRFFDSRINAARDLHSVHLPLRDVHQLSGNLLDLRSKLQLPRLSVREQFQLPELRRA